MLIDVKVKTNSSKKEVVKKDSGYIVSLHSSPRDGKANKELIEFLAEYFDVPKSNIEILKGIKGRNKIVSIEK